ncbi:MAG: CocE/NonD family hydrolase [Bryobacteraceae bacterium]|nr:CocE/NonD family hydrolase [Solibacteraceae bacterium]MCO5352302.1 CocE/NonD family hydrolase [Bryobacteraceae bacterium]
MMTGLRTMVLASMAASLFGQAPGAPFDMLEARNIQIPARDGVMLGADLFFPARGGMLAPGRHPVILERTPYGTSRASLWAKEYVRHGYVVMVQNVRGRYSSGGTWRGHVDDPNDGFDTAAWIAAQPWSNGRIGTVGFSYSGATQHAMALGNAPALSAMIPVDAMSTYGRFGVRHRGAFELRFINWIMAFGNSPSGDSSPMYPDHFPGETAEARAEMAQLRKLIPEYVRSLPLRRGVSRLRMAPEYEDWILKAMGHGDYDEYWRETGASVLDHIDRHKDVPAYHVTGWYDSWSLISTMNYEELSKAKKSPQKLIVGPWTHGGQTLSHAGDAEFGPEAALDFHAFQRRWFDRWLKGEPNGADGGAPVRIFVMGAGEPRRTPEGRLFVGGRWREEKEWPLSRAKPTNYYLHADGRLSPTLPGDAPPSVYLFDPKDPVPTIGGNVSSEGLLMKRGAIDQRCGPAHWACRNSLPLSARSDVLVFQSEPLKEDMEVTGRLVVTLYASSSAVDTDFTAKLIDVYPPGRDYPNGVELNVGDSIVRARYRNSLQKAEMMEPGKPYKFTIEMYPTSLVFRKGHRIRVDISSSNFPRFDVNPNTGEPLNAQRRWKAAENSIYHDPGHPSHITLPVIPASGSGSR